MEMRSFGGENYREGMGQATSQRWASGVVPEHPIFDVVITNALVIDALRAFQM